MSKLEFFCNRPTIVALINFGLDISSGNKVTSSTDTATTSSDKLSVKDEKGAVRGLLGYGKDRVVFYLNMNVDSVTVFLNKEDGSQLATLVQESFLLDLKVMRNLFVCKLESSFLFSLAFSMLLVVYTSYSFSFSSVLKALVLSIIHCHMYASSEIQYFFCQGSSKFSFH